jgi:hypothetical protein
LLQNANFEPRGAEACFLLLLLKLIFFLLKHYAYCAVLEIMPHVEEKFDDGGHLVRMQTRAAAFA